MRVLGPVFGSFKLRNTVTSRLFGRAEKHWYDKQFIVHKNTLHDGTRVKTVTIKTPLLNANKFISSSFSGSNVPWQSPLRIQRGLRKLVPSGVEVGEEGLYMDSGVYFPAIPATQNTYPIRCYINSDIKAHLAQGYSIEGFSIETDGTYVFMPGHVQSNYLCVNRWTIPDGIPTETNAGGTYYESPVYTSVGRISSLYAFNLYSGEFLPPHRWTGRNRFWAQTKLGIGQTLYTLCSPDIQGLLISEDGSQFYRVTIMAYPPYNDIKITPLKINSLDSDCMIDLIQFGLPVKQHERVLAHALARLVVDGSRDEYEITTPFAEPYRVPLSYGWHWAYQRNECSTVLVKQHERGDGTKDMELVTLLFDVPNDPEQLVTVGLSSVETGTFLPDSQSAFWPRSFYEGKPHLNKLFTTGLENDPTGDLCPVHCFYAPETDVLKVLRYTYLPADTEWIDPVVMPDPADTTCNETDTFEGWTVGFWNSAGGRWTCEDITVDAVIPSGYRIYQKRIYVQQRSGVTSTRTFSGASQAGQCSGSISNTYSCDPSYNFITDRESSYTSGARWSTAGTLGDDKCAVFLAAYDPDCVFFTRREDYTSTVHRTYYLSDFGAIIAAWVWYAGGTAPLPCSSYHLNDGVGSFMDYYNFSTSATDIDSYDYWEAAGDIYSVWGIGAYFQYDEIETTDDVIVEFFDVFAETAVAYYNAVTSFNGQTRYSKEGWLDYGGDYKDFPGDSLMQFTGWA